MGKERLAEPFILSNEGAQYYWAERGSRDSNDGEAVSVAQPGRQHKAAQEHAEGNKGGCARAWGGHPKSQPLNQ